VIPMKCSAIARSGNRCTTTVVTGSNFCYLHDPALVERRREAARKGGRNRSTKARAAAQIPETMSPADLAGWLSLLFKNVIEGRVEPRIGTAAATIAKVLLEVRTATALEQRLSELESRAGIGNEHDWRVG
jgi:hypothetical protein